MVAVALHAPTERPRLAIVGPRPDRAVVHRRRTAAVVLALAAVMAAAITVHALLAALGGGPLTTPERPGASAVYVVQAGDTFWDIARRLDPGGDPRPLVARLVAAHGGPGLRAGERIGLPATP